MLINRHCTTRSKHSVTLSSSTNDTGGDGTGCREVVLRVVVMFSDHNGGRVCLVHGSQNVNVQIRFVNGGPTHLCRSSVPPFGLLVLTPPCT